MSEEKLDQPEDDILSQVTLPFQITATADLVVWFSKDQMQETFEEIMKAGPMDLRDYAQERKSAVEDFNANPIDQDQEHFDCVITDIALQFVDWEIAYLIIRDWDKHELWRTLTESHVKEYMGAYIEDDGDELTPSASSKVKLFGASSLAEVSRISGVPVRTLQDWFVNRKLAFHAVMEFAINTIERTEEE